METSYAKQGHWDKEKWDVYLTKLYALDFLSPNDSSFVLNFFYFARGRKEMTILFCLSDRSTIVGEGIAMKFASNIQGSDRINPDNFDHLEPSSVKFLFAKNFGSWWPNTWKYRKINDITINLNYSSHLSSTTLTLGDTGLKNSPYRVIYSLRLTKYYILFAVAFYS